MSSVSEVAAETLAQLADIGAVTDRLALDDDVLLIDNRPAVVVPPADGPTGWRRTVNRSLLPASISPENRRHLLYAVLQDLVRPELLLHSSTRESAPLAELDPALAPFDDVYRVPAEGRSDRVILFPIHVAVPTVFDTYDRRPNLKPQTDKGFRGRFIEFFSSDEAGFFDDHLLRVLRNLFAMTDSMTPLDRALVEALGRRVATERGDSLTQEETSLAKSGSHAWWSAIYPPLPSSCDYRPLMEFAAQGARLHADIDAIAHAPGLSRIERVAFVERLLAYHFSLYLVRLTRVLYRELDWAYRRIWPERTSSPWSGLNLDIRFNERRPQVPRSFHGAYTDLVERLNEAYLLLPLLNNMELAIAAVGRAETGPAKAGDTCWAEARADLEQFSLSELGQLREVLTFFAQMGRRHAHLEGESCGAETLKSDSIELLFEAIRMHYTAPANRRYPKNHHQTVFDTVAGGGSDSFLQRQPFKHFALGDELVYLLVLALFEQREVDERSDSTCVPRSARKLRRRRLPLSELEDRLAEDLLVPNDDAAREDLRASLARLGLLDRLSDVGEGNFLRHPTGI